MQKRPINLYTSKPADAGFLSLADLLSQQQPVNLCDISDLPAPDQRRPTRQQLRTERADVERELTTCRSLIRLYSPHPRLTEEVGQLKQEAKRHQTRLEQIDAALGQEGGQADG